MGSGEVAIVALSTMISLKVTFSDGLGGVVVCLLILQFFYCVQFFQPSVIEINHLAGCIID